MNIYVSNLSFSFLEQDLNKLFSEFGNVTSAKLVVDKFTGKSKGFGFVDMPDRDQAEKSVKGLNGKIIDGRPLRAAEAKAKMEYQSKYSSPTNRY